MSVGILRGRYLIETLGEFGGKAWVHWCSACRCCHLINTELPNQSGAKWSFDGVVESPTFAPSIDIGRNTAQRCHYFIENGAIRYVGDSLHAFAGRTVPMSEFPEHVLDAYAEGNKRADDLLSMTKKEEEP